MDQAGNGGMDLVVFGASGDLARRKVLPAIGAVARGRVHVLGVGRSDLSRAAFQRLVGETTGSDELAAGADWVRLDYAAAETYSGLREALHSRPAVYYLATPPSTFRPILSALAGSGLTHRGDGSRSWWRSPSERTPPAPASWIVSWASCSKSHRSTASTTTWPKTRRIGAKRPGAAFELVLAGLKLDYAHLAKGARPDAYENVFNEVLTGDHAVFPGAREIERSWEIVDPLLQAWEEGGRPAPYARGSWGPEEAKALLAARGGGRWITSGDEPGT